MDTAPAPAPPLSRRPDPWLVTGLGLFALLVGLGAANRSVVTLHIFIDYALEAQRMAAEGLAGYTDPLHPVGYPLLLLVAGAVTGNLHDGARALSAISGVIALWLGWRIALRVFGRDTARGTLLLVPVATAFTLSALTAESMMPSIALQLWAVERMLRQRPRADVQAGIAAGLAYLVRYQSFLLVVAATLWHATRRSRPFTARGGAIARIALPFLLVAAPQLAINASRGLNPLIGRSTQYLAQEMEDEYTKESGIALALEAPAELAAQWAEAAALFVIWNPFLLAGFLASFRRRRDDTRSMLNAIVIVYTLGVLANLFSARALLLGSVLTVPYLAEALPGWARAARAALVAPARRGMRGVVAAFVIGPLIALALPFALFRIGLAVGELRHVLELDTVSRSHHEVTDALHAGGYDGDLGTLLGCSHNFYDLEAARADRWVLYQRSLDGLGLLPELPRPEDLIAYMRAHGRRYLLYQPADRGTCPDMPYLLEPETLPAEIELLHFDDFYDFEPGLVVARLGDGAGDTPRAPVERSTAGRLLRWLDALDRGLRGELDDAR